MSNLYLVLKNLSLVIFATFVVLVFGPIAFIINLFRYKFSHEYLFTIAVGIDQLGGSFLYNEEDWTVSSYTYYLCEYKHKMCWFKKFIDFLFGKNHCERSYIWEKEVNCYDPEQDEYEIN